MPVIQISQIKHRRGTKNSLPTLSEGELGFTIDSGELFIGSPNFPEAAQRNAQNKFPYGNTQILTEFSKNIEDLLKYTYRYRNPSNLNIDAALPTRQNGQRIIRYLQERLDEIVSVKSYGVRGNGYLSYSSVPNLRAQLNLNDPNFITEQTYLFRKAILDVALTLSDNTTPDGWKKRALYVPAGIYVIEDYLPIPPNVSLFGDGKDQTIIIIAPPSNINVPCLTTIDENVTLSDLDNDLLNNFIGSNITNYVSGVTIKGITFLHAYPRDVFRAIRIRDSYFEDCGFGHLQQDSKITGDWNPIDSVALLIDTESGNMMPPYNLIFDRCDFFNSTYGVFATSDSRCISFNQCTFSGHYRGVRLGETVGLTRSQLPTDYFPGGPRGGPSSYRIENSVFRNIYAEAFSVLTINNVSGLNVNIEGLGGFHISSGNRYENCGHGSRIFPATPYSYGPPVAPVIHFGNGTVYNVSIFDTFDRNQTPSLPIENRVLYNQNDPNIILNPQDPVFIFGNIIPPISTVNTLSRTIVANQPFPVDFSPVIQLPATNRSVKIEYSVSIGATYRKTGTLIIVDNGSTNNYTDSFTFIGSTDFVTLNVTSISFGVYRIQYTNTSSQSGLFKYSIKDWSML